ncbi:acyltransferase [Streptococcus sp. E17BB]
MKRLLGYLRLSLLPMSKYPDYLRSQGVKIGNNCEIYKSAQFGSEPYLIQLGNHVRVNAGVNFVTHDGGLWVLRNHPKYKEVFAQADRFGKILVKDNVHIGTNAMIMPGITIGENAIVATCAVVTKDVPPNTIVGGVPARIIESLDEYASKMEGKIVLTKGMTSEEKRQFLEKTILERGKQ